MALTYSFPNFEPVCCSTSSSSCSLLPAYRFLRRQVRWFGIPISLRIFQFVVIHAVKGFSIVSESFLEYSCSLCDPETIGNLVSGSSAFSKPSLYYWKYVVHILLKPNLKDFEHDLAGMWNEVHLYHSLNIFWHCPSLGLEWKLTFSSPMATAEFSKFADILNVAL